MSRMFRAGDTVCGNRRVTRPSLKFPLREGGGVDFKPNSRNPRAVGEEHYALSRLNKWLPYA